MFFRLLRAFARNQRGTVSVVSAIALPTIVGFGALVAEYGHGLVTRTQNQRIADLAAYAGGRAYLQTGSTTSMTAAAQSVAAMNGVPASQISVGLVTSPRTASSQAVQATIATTQTLLLAPVLGAGRTLSVTAQAQAEISAQSSSCILALSGSGTGVTLSGGTKISAPQCSVNSNNTISVPCGTTLSAKSVTYNSSAAPSQPCSGITSSSITKVLTADPLANNTGVQTATARVATVAAMAAPTMSSVSGGGNIDLLTTSHRPSLKRRLMAARPRCRGIPGH